jgi:flagellin
MVSLNTNIQSLTAQRLVNINQNNLARTQARLSSGMRINSASDDPSGLAISQSMTSQINGDTVAKDINIQHARSMIGVADAALSQIADILQRMRDLAVQGNNSSLTTSESTALNNEFTSLKTAITNIGNGTSFNGKQLLDGTGGTITLQTGWQTTSTSTVALTTDYRSTGTLALTAASVSSQANASTAVGTVDTAIAAVSSGRSTFGASDQALAAQQASLDAGVIATKDARSKIQDTDAPTEISNLIRQQLLQQSGASALSAANFSAQFVVKLLS